MPPDIASLTAELDNDEDQYDSAEDSDFQLDDDAAPDAESGMSDSEDEEAGEEPVTKKRKIGNKDTRGPEEELDSGDEAMIQKAKAKKDKKRKSGEVDEDVDEGEAGGFVRTRAMKMRIGEERKPLAKIDGATVDVDALWAKMNSTDPGIGGPSQSEKKDDATPVNEQEGETHANNNGTATSAPEPQTYTEEMIKIKRTYKFAGEMITEEKLVPKDSAEAKLFLAGENDAKTVSATDADPAKEAIKLRRPLRRPSRFDPNPTGAIKKSWEKAPVTKTTGQENARGPKINTVEKSRLDWAAYVDQAGIKDELNEHSKAKEGFLGRMDFLDRVGANIDEERRNARLKGLPNL
ncbi:putative Swr1p complex component (Swc5) [Aspergillus ibericus CBS 121593]|uniref:SWR1-complex protein 5 n=1 Tax=Aspergillus ibericus CBS 121593 TaxID=1448316 RepID=A0A395HD98_9EURO|nr:putative Swr1p complex component [Aspergillus ibericus CBS 121593]RAL05479.1 putative Swr1p complex component [Aspergillus ibericus CBS 121593]